MDFLPILIVLMTVAGVPAAMVLVLILVLRGHRRRIANLEEQLGMAERRLRLVESRLSAARTESAPAPAPALAAPPPLPVAARVTVPPPGAPLTAAAPPPIADYAPRPAPKPPVRPVPPPTPVSAPAAAQEAIPFLTQREAQAPKSAPSPVSAATSPAPPPAKEKDTVSWEVKLATQWLPKIGGVLMIVAAAFIAMWIQPKLGPGARVALAYGVAVVIAAAGAWVLRRSDVVGRTTIVIAAAMAYFVSFAAHFIPPMHIFHAIPSILLMGVFAAAIVAMAEWWKSETVAGLGFGLGILSALISARVSDGYGLLALAIIALAAGVMLVRHEWTRLTALALLTIYGSTVALWFLLPIGSSPNEIGAHLGALVFYHLVFAAAALRWGRSWIARERAMETAEADYATPRIQAGLLPYNSAFLLLNSLLLASLSVYLLWLTKTWWNEVEYLLAALAVAEGVRAGLKSRHRSGIAPFHALMCFALGSAAVIAAFSGLVESAVLAGLTLAVAVAATRAHVLRWLRPLTIATAGLAVVSFSPSAATPMDLAGELLPGVLLLLSALHWQHMWTRRPVPTSRPLFVLETISGQLRALIATGLLLASLEGYFPATTSAGYVFIGVSLVLLAGVIVLNARNWFAAAAFLCLVHGAFVVLASNSELPPALLNVLWLGAVMALWGDYARKADHWARQALGVLVAVGAGIMGAAILGKYLEDARPYFGIAAFGAAAACAVLAWSLERLPAIPSLVSLPTPEDAQPGLLQKAPLLRPGYVAAGLLLMLSVFATIALDAPESLVSALAMTVVLAGLWRVSMRRQPSALEVQGATFAAALLVLTLSIMMYSEWQLAGVLVCALIVMTGLLVGGAFRSAAAGISSAVICCAVPILFVVLTFPDRMLDAHAALLGLSTAAVLFIASRYLSRLRRRLAELSLPVWAPDFLRNAGVWLLLVATGAALFFLSTGGMLPAKLITASWGAVGALLLAWGLAQLDAPMRFTAFGVLALAIGRIFLRDLVGADKLTTAIAAFAVAAVTLGAAIAYGFLKRRLDADKQNAAPDNP